MSESTQRSLRPGRLARLGEWCYMHRARVVLAWLALIIGGFAVNAAYGGEFATMAPQAGSESGRAYELLRERFPARSGDTIDVVYQAEAGVRDPAVRSRIETLLGEVDQLPHVAGVTSPYTAEGQSAVAAGGEIAYATVQLDVTANQMPVADTQKLIALAEDARSPELRVHLAGEAVTIAAEEAPAEPVALVAAAVILLIAFGSVLAMFLPILSAVIGLAAAVVITGLLMHVVDVIDVAPAVAAMIGLGVGIDYALLIVTRYRQSMADGLDPRAATVVAIDSAGRSVLFAGCTVVVCLLGMFTMGTAFMYGMAVAAMTAVLMVMLVSITLLPAMLGFIGGRIDRLRLPGLGRAARTGRSPLAYRWSRTVQRHPWPTLVLCVLTIGVLTLPVLALRVGFPDASNDPVNSTTRQAHSLLVEGFGPGYNGPLQLVAELPDKAAAQRLDTLAGALRGVPGVASVSPPLTSPAGDVAVLRIVPTEGPQSEQTADLVHRLRDQVLPAELAGTGITTAVGGPTAFNIDLSEYLASRMPYFIGGILLVAMLVLLVAFRSVAVAVKATVVNLLSVGAAFGVTALAVEGGWLGELVGISEPIPLPVFVPILMFAILFGLSMDYEVFLLSRIREEYDRTGDNSRAVADGVANTARVITAAAAVMVAVFAAFILSPEVFLKATGIGMAAAIIIDATLIRLALVPAVMQVLGRANWWVPVPLDRWLPRLPEIAEPRSVVAADPPRRAEPVTQSRG